MDDPPAFTTLEVAKHSSAADAWLIIGGRVLNISSWLHDHPGGDVVLLDLAGTLQRVCAPLKRGFACTAADETRGKESEKKKKN